MDLLLYLRTYEPQEPVHFGGSTYCTHEYDNLKIFKNPLTGNRSVAIMTVTERLLQNQE